MTHNINTLKSSLRSKIFLALFLAVIIGGVFINFLMHTSLQTHLFQEGWDNGLIKDIDDHIAFFGAAATFTGIVIVLVVAIYLSKTITGPVKKLADGMTDIAGGEWTTRIEVNNDDELGRLAGGFNFMAEHIEKSLKELKSARDYTDNILGSVPSLLIVLSNRLNILSRNASFDKLNEQYPALTISQFVQPLEDRIISNLHTGEVIKEEITLVPEGSDDRLIFSSVISRIGNNSPNDDEEKPSVLLTLTDITEHRMMRELVIQSRQDWEDTFNIIPDMITIHDRNYNIVKANKSAKQALNLPFLDTEKVNKCYKHFHGTDSAPDGCPSCNCYRSGKPVTFEMFEPHLNKYIEIRAIPRVNDAGEVVGLIHITRDITQRKKIEEEHNRLNDAIKKAKIEWELTFDSATEFILLVDKELGITRCNRSFAEFVGVPIDRIVGHKCMEYFPDAYENPEDIKNGSREAEDSLINCEVETDSGRWLYLNHRPIKDIKSKSLHSVLIVTDITELKKAQQRNRTSELELKKKVEDLEKFYDMAVGRELRMRELKKEIKRLNNEPKDYQGNEYAAT